MARPLKISRPALREDRSSVHIITGERNRKTIHTAGQLRNLSKIRYCGKIKYVIAGHDSN